MLKTDWSLDMLSESIEEDCRDIHGHGNLQVHCYGGQEGHCIALQEGHCIAAMRSHFEPQKLSFMPHPLPLAVGQWLFL